MSADAPPSLAVPGTGAHYVASDPTQASQQLIQQIEKLILFPDRIEKPAQLTQIWQAFHDEVGLQMDFDAAALLLVDVRSHAFDLCASTPAAAAAELQKEIDAQIECGMFAWVVNRRQPALFPSLTIPKPCTMVMLPLTTQTRTIGLILLATTIEQSLIRQDRMKLLGILAKQCAMVIENTMLYEDLRVQHESLREAQSQIIQAEKFAAFGRLTSGAFHELLNPLNIISSYLQLMQLTPPGPDQLADYAALMRSAADRMAAIVQSLLQISAPRHGQRQSLALVPLLHRAKDKAALRHASQSITIAMHVPQNLPGVQANPEELEQLVGHLLDNAYEAMPQGGTIAIEAETLPTADLLPEAGRAVICRVCDRGCGIAAANLNKIFDPFFTTKPVGQGIGLNLAICYALARSLGGTITARNRDDGGAVFALYLPAAQT
jgi:signal transduction histidine kinase